MDMKEQIKIEQHRKFVRFPSHVVIWKNKNNVLVAQKGNQIKRSTRAK